MWLNSLCIHTLNHVTGTAKHTAQPLLPNTALLLQSREIARLKRKHKMAKKLNFPNQTPGLTVSNTLS